MTPQEEMKQAHEQMMTALTEFRNQNDTRLKLLEARQPVPADLTATIDKANADITAHQGKIDELAAKVRETETLVARLEVLGNPKAGEAQEALKNRARQFFNQVRGRGKRLPDPTAEDLKAYAEYEASYELYLRAPSDRNGLSLVPEIRNAMTTGTDSEGGYAVPPDRTGKIVQLVYESSPMRQFADVVTTSRREKTGRTDLGTTSGFWGGEGAPPTEATTAGLGEWRIPVHDLISEPRATADELEDAEFDIEAWHNSKVGELFGRMEAVGFVSGNGVTRPRGFLTYPAGTPGATADTWPVIQQLPTGVSGGFAAAPAGGDVFHDCVGAMKTFYRQGAVWAMNRTTEAAARKLKDSDGAYLWQPGLQAGTPSQIIGYPVAPFEDMPVLAASSLSIAFANFKLGYQIVDRRGITVLRDPFTGKPFVKFYTTKRVGGDVVNFEAIKLIRFNT